MAGVFKREGDDTLIENQLLPIIFKSDEAWFQLTDYLKNIQNQQLQNYKELTINNNYYYVYHLDKYGYLILGKCNSFNNVLKNELQFVINYLGKILFQSVIEKQRRISEEKLAIEQKLLRTIIDNIPINIYTKDKSFKKTLVNGSEIRHLNKTQEDEVLGKTDFDLFDKKLAEQFLLEDKQVLESGNAILNEEKYIGNDRWAFVSKLPLKDMQGNITGIVGMSFDITERKKEQDQLSFLFQILDNLSDSVRVMSEDGRLYYLNKSACRDLNIKPEDINKYNIWDITNTIEDENHWKRHLKELKTNKINILEGANVDIVTGKVFPIELNISFLNIRGQRLVLAIGRDLTRRKAAEKALRESEEFKASLISSMNDMVFVLDNQLRFIEYHKPAFDSSFTLPDDYLNKKLTSVGISEPAISTIQKTITECQHFKWSKSEFYIDTNLNRNWFELTATILNDQFGNQSGITCVIRNITERINSGEIIKQQLKLQEILIRISSVYINANLETVNENIENSLRELSEFVGADRAYIYDYNFKDFSATNTFEWCATGINPNCKKLQKLSLNHFAHQIAKHLKGEEFYIDYSKEDTFENTITTGKNVNKNTIISTLTFPMLLHNDLIGFIGFDNIRNLHEYSSKEKDLLSVFSQMLVNVRERKNHESLLKIQEQKYRNIISNMKLGLIEIDFDEYIQFANDTFCKMTGYELEDIIGKKVVDALLFAEDFDFPKKIRESRIKGESGSYEIGIKNKRGEKCWWYISGAPNFNDKKELIGSIGVFLDISEQKKMKKELEDALKKAEDASRAKELFLANMSHEIRTPLNVITGMIRELGKERLTEKQKSYIKYSESAADHLLTIINNILDISKIEAGEYELINKVFNISALASNVGSILFSKINDKNLNFILEVSNQIKPALIGDVSRIRQILINLVNNSIKFTESGYIKLSISLVEETIYSQKLLFEVEDSGIGMTEDFLSKLFDKFSQEVVAANRKFEGTGLGMSIAKELVQLMGGDIVAQSKKGVGTKISFVLNLPIGDETKLINSKPSNFSDSLMDIEVLLVEDNEMNRFIAVQSMKHVGCNVTEAVNGLDAIEKIKKGSFDIILMDIQMPEMDGVEATKYIRKNIDNTIPIVALTANAFKHDIDNYIAAGMNHFLIKPYLETDLYNIIEKYTSVNRNKTAVKTDKKTVVQSLYNTSQLLQLSNGNIDFVKQMLRLFVELSEQTILQFSELQKNKDYENIKRLAHKIKPSIDNMKVDILNEKIRILEKFNVSNENIVDFDELVSYVSATLQKVIDQIKKNEDL